MMNNDILYQIDQLLRNLSVQRDITSIIFALILSAIVGAIVSAIYQIFYENRATGAQIHRCFLLMSISMTALFTAVQYSLPLSVGLIGSLSIIRFRTPIKEPEEVGFIMLLIATAVVCAKFQFLLLFVLLGLALAVLTFQKYFPRLFHSKRRDGILLITLDGNTPTETKEKIMNLLEMMLSNGKLESASFSENLTTIQYSFAGLNSKHLGGLQTSLNQIAPIQKMNIFFNSQGALF